MATLHAVNSTHSLNSTLNPKPPPAVIKVFAEIFLEYCVPVTFNEANGAHIVWIRYAEWLLTCPVSARI